MTFLISKIFYFGPLIFAFGFIMPLTAQILERTSWSSPLGLTPLLVGFFLAATWGTIAQIKGRWI